MSYSGRAYLRYLEGGDADDQAEAAFLSEQLAERRAEIMSAELLLPPGYRIVLSTEAEAAAEQRRDEWEDAQEAMAEGRAEWRRRPNSIGESGLNG